MIRKIIFLIIASVCLNANPTTDVQDENTTVAASLEEIISSKNDIDNELKDSIWITSYENYRIYQQLKNRQSVTEDEIFRLEKRTSLSNEQETKLKHLNDTKDEIDAKLKLLGEYTNDPFEKLVAPSQIGNTPKITNPFSIFAGLSFLENIKSEQSDYKQKYKSLSNTVKNLSQKEQILKEMISVSPDNDTYKKDLRITQKLLSAIEPYMDVSKSTQQVYDKKAEEVALRLSQEIKEESKKAIWVGVTISILFGFLLLAKHLVRKYISDAKRIYKFNKVLNIVFVIVIILVLLFSYIENAGYLATILGFASAGIAIAMKEWFMSFIGWLSIFFGGSIKVGDRVRVVKDGTEYIGDIINISPLKMTLYEDITLATYTTNRRAGRIIFIPNNYIFTNMIASYTHEEMDTVWDGIDFMVTFDSDIEKTTIIAKEVAIEHSNKYVESTKKQLNKLRMKYHIRGMDVEPRIFTMIGEYGMKISLWYYTNSFSTLRSRSLISSEIISRINKEQDIHIAYPAQHITIDK